MVAPDRDGNAKYRNALPFGRRNFLAGAAALGIGAVGSGSTTASSDDPCNNPVGPWQDYDHSGDALGRCSPLESVRTKNVSIENFDLPSTCLVFEHDGIWYAMQSSTQDIVYKGEDGGEVINSALEDIAGSGNVRVVPSARGASALTTSTTIDHTKGGTGLILEKGLTLNYTGEDAAVDLAGNGLLFSFDQISSGGKYCLRDIGAGVSYVDGYQLRGASDSLWVTDTPNFDSPGVANNYINIRWPLCSFGYGDEPYEKPTPYGVKLKSAPGALSEGHRWELGTVMGPGKKGILIGENNEHDSNGFNIFYVDIDPLGGGVESTEVLVEINDEQNGVVLEGYTPAVGGDWDVIIRDTSHDSFVTSVTSRQLLRIKRESIESIDQTKFDPVRHETFEVDLLPESLDAYGVNEIGSGRVTLNLGQITQETGKTSESWANVHRPIPLDYANLSFTNQAVLQTNVEVSENTNQKAWLLWGDREGQAVGWHIVDDTLEGYVSDGENTATVALESGFDTGTAWNLTAFYNPPTDVHFYVRPPLETVDSPEQFSQPVRDGVNKILWPDALASIDEAIPSGSADSKIAVSIDLTNTDGESKRLSWSNWRNYQYPLQGKWNPFRVL